MHRARRLAQRLHERAFGEAAQARRRLRRGRRAQWRLTALAGATTEEEWLADALEGYLETPSDSGAVLVATFLELVLDDLLHDRLGPEAPDLGDPDDPLVERVSPTRVRVTAVFPVELDGRDERWRLDAELSLAPEGSTVHVTAPAEGDEPKTWVFAPVLRRSALGGLRRRLEEDLETRRAGEALADALTAYLDRPSDEAADGLAWIADLVDELLHEDEDGPPLAVEGYENRAIEVAGPRSVRMTGLLIHLDDRGSQPVRALTAELARPPAPCTVRLATADTDWEATAEQIAAEAAASPLVWTVVLPDPAAGADRD